MSSELCITMAIITINMYSSKHNTITLLNRINYAT